MKIFATLEMPDKSMFAAKVKAYEEARNDLARFLSLGGLCFEAGQIREQSETDIDDLEQCKMHAYKIDSMSVERRKP